MTDSPPSVEIFCNRCNRATDHSVQGTYTHPPGTPNSIPYPSFEVQELRSVVKLYFEQLTEWPTPEHGWVWVTNPDDWVPDHDIPRVVEGLEVWLDNSPRLLQELWPEEGMMTWKLRKQGWSWFDILLACERGIAKQDRWEILKCKGCKSPSLRVMKWSEDDDVRNPETGQLLKRKELPEYYPPRAINHRQTWLLPSWANQLPEAVQRLLNESYLAMNEGFLAVGSMGIRSVVEIAMVELVGSKGGFEQKLDRLLDQRIITDTERGSLNSVVDFGHAAVHRQQNPTANDVQKLINQVERFLWKSFVMPHEASELLRNTRPRS
jgi:hypothetical protein